MHINVHNRCDVTRSERKPHFLKRGNYRWTSYRQALETFVSQVDLISPGFGNFCLSGHLGLLSTPWHQLFLKQRFLLYCRAVARLSLKWLTGEDLGGSPSQSSVFILENTSFFFSLSFFLPFDRLDFGFTSGGKVGAGVGFFFHAKCYLLGLESVEKIAL